MSGQFRIETSRLLLTWSAPRNPPPRVVDHGEATVHFKVVGLGGGAQPQVEHLHSTWPIGLLWEQTDYKVMVRSKGSDPIGFEQRDPSVLRDLESEDEGRLWFGVVNYGSQIGRTVWRIWVGDQPELELHMEVFPSKLTYRADYDAIMHDIQGVLTGLAMEYMRATTQPGRVMPRGSNTDVEWVTLLRLSLTELGQALNYVREHPRRVLASSQAHVRPERARAQDTLVRRHQRRQDVGPLSRRVPTSRQVSVLDEAQHLWIASELQQIHARLGHLLDVERSRMGHPSGRALARVQELDALTQQTSFWARTWSAGRAPGAHVAVVPPVALKDAGYAEVHRIFSLLTGSLQLTDGPLRLHVKDLSRLYEFWCYLRCARLLNDLLDAELELDELFAVRAQGLHVTLAHGQPSRVVLFLRDGGRCVLTYNPSFRAHTLFEQRPDMVLSFEREGWPALKIVFDAKYRLNPRGEVGPPTDAINSLHRYRDAILVEHQGELMHQVVQAVALFPYKEATHEVGSYRNNRLWLSLHTHGVGAIPMLPEATGYAREWLGSLLRQHGWGLAQEAVSHVAVEALHHKSARGQEIALVGVLRSQWSEHLAWIHDTHQYLMPHRAKHPRSLQVKWLGIYVPAHDGLPGAVRLMARVIDVSVVERSSVDTPWPTRAPGALYVRYTLGVLQPLDEPIINQQRGPHKAQRFSHPRWTTALTLERARHIDQLVIRDAATWALHDALQGLEPALVTESFDAAVGGVWFVGTFWRVYQDRFTERYVVTRESEFFECATIDEVVEVLEG